MFEQLLMADVVIADISVHNANVYYELGIRHSLQPRTTILIRAHRDEVPFDLKTDRYLEYNAENPASARDSLTKAVRQSLCADNVDSPVFLLLPALEPIDPERFHPVPRDFLDEVKAAQHNADRPMLAVLSEEAAEFDWRFAGLRMVAKAQYNLSAWPDARATLETMLSKRQGDLDLNLMLATVYQRLNAFAKSNTAIERVLSGSELPTEKKAEALALRGRNTKALWIADWEALPVESRQAAALRSGNLDAARRTYDEAFLVNQNHYYSGVNSLALLVVKITLAEREPKIWLKRFKNDDAQASSTLAQLRLDRDELLVVVKHSLDGETFRCRANAYNVWLDLTRADLRLLACDEPSYVADGYDAARAGLAAAGLQAAFPAESAAQQIRLYLKLGLFTTSARAALNSLGMSEEPPQPPPQARLIVFSGHRIDAPGRAEPRFPADVEDAAKNVIRNAVAAEKDLAGGASIEGLAGGASGGDILFHEICAELGISTTLLLALPPNDFVSASVADAGPNWIQRFHNLNRSRIVKILPSGDKDLPRWLAQREDYSIWHRNNRWMLHSALSRMNVDVTLIVLWDGQGGDGPGGTEDMVNLAKARGVRTVLLSTSKLIRNGRDGSPL